MIIADATHIGHIRISARFARAVYDVNNIIIGCSEIDTLFRSFLIYGDCGEEWEYNDYFAVASPEHQFLLRTRSNNIVSVNRLPINQPVFIPTPGDDFEHSYSELLRVDFKKNKTTVKSFFEREEVQECGLRYTLLERDEVVADLKKKTFEDADLVLIKAWKTGER